MWFIARLRRHSEDCSGAEDRRLPEREVDLFWFQDDEPSASDREAAVWGEVAAAFREPVIRGDDRAGYAATQIITELFQQEGYDGIVYGSGFGDDATNIALFDTTAAEVVACEIHRVKGVKLDHGEIDNPYHVRKGEEGEVELYRTVLEIIGPVDAPGRDPAAGGTSEPSTR